MWVALPALTSPAARQSRTLTASHNGRYNVLILWLQHIGSLCPYHELTVNYIFLIIERFCKEVYSPCDRLFRSDFACGLPIAEGCSMVFTKPFSLRLRLAKKEVQTHVP